MKIVLAYKVLIVPFLEAERNIYFHEIHMYGIQPINNLFFVNTLC